MQKILIFKISIIFFVILILGVGFFALKNKSIVPSNNSLSDRCNQKNLPYLNSNLSVQERVDDLMSRMNDWEKIGQMALIEKNSIHDLSDITRYNLGALLSGGGAGPKEDNPVAWLSMVNDFQAAAEIQ